MANFLFLAGSRSEDFEDYAAKTNPLPPCPDSPNCVRFTKKLEASKNTVLKAAKSALKEMGPIELKTIDDPLRLRAVFKVLFFKDDFVVLIEEESDSSSHIHIRSSSRVGHSDLGVNRRRVKRFLKKLKSKF